MGYRALLAAVLGLFNLAANANLAIDRAIIEFRPGEEYFTDINIYNRGQERLYINVSIKEVLNPGQPGERLQPLLDPDQAGLVATPNLLSLAPQQSGRVRLLNLDENMAAERIYRVLVEPVQGRLKAQEKGVSVLLSYDLLVMARQQKPAAVLRSRRQGKTMLLYNSGNTNAFLEDGRQCNPDAATECREILGERIYPGATVAIELPWAGAVRFRVDDGSKPVQTTFTGQDTLPEGAVVPAK